MLLSPEQKIVKIEEVRYAMIKSAEAHGGAIHPATKIDITGFYNHCTGCEAAIKQLHNFKEATITENLWKEINTFTEQVELLRDEVVKFDKSYTLDAPLVKCLSRLMNKGDTVLREVKKQCNQEYLKTFGEDWMNETNERYAKDLQVIIKDLSPCVAYSSSRRTQRLQAAAASKNPAKPVQNTKPVAVPTSTTMGSGTAAKGSTGVSDSTGQNTGVYGPSPPIAGAADNEKHITFVPPAADNEKPEEVGLAMIPHFKGPNYINLPQFTGVPEHTLPIFQKEMPPMHTTPDAENIYMAHKFPPP